MHKNVDFWQLNKEEQKVANMFLGKAPIYMGNTFPEVKGKHCLITGIIPGLEPNTVAFYLKHENFKTFGLERVHINNIDKVFELQSIQINNYETAQF